MMPLLRKYVDRDGFYITTSIKGNLVTYQVSTDGAEKLRTAGIKPGDKFSRFVLLELYQSGDVFTGHSGPGDAFPAGHPEQGELDFTNDPEPEAAIPVCSQCSSPNGLHLVGVKDEKPRALILCLGCRDSVTRLNASIPLPLVSRKILNRFLAIEDIKDKDMSVIALQNLLDRDFSKQWEALRRKKPIQEVLIPGADPQGSLL
jgi:hypothetical protein